MTETPRRQRDDAPAIAAYATMHGLGEGAAAAEWRFIPGEEREKFRSAARAAIAEHKADGIAAGRIADLLEGRAKLLAELREQTRDHDRLIEELLQNAGEEHGSDEGAAEAVAVRYVRHLEAETTRLACVVRGIQITAGDALKSADDREADSEDADPVYGEPPRPSPSGRDPYQFPTLAELGGEKLAGYPSEAGL